MPTYVYECRTCELVFEAEQRISEDPLTDCSCGAKGSLRRLIQPVAVSFRGEGFHINDYAAKPVEPAPESNAADSPKSEPTAKTETKSD